MATEVAQILNPPAPIVAFAYNGKRDQLAISPNTNEVWIYEKKGGEWGTTPIHVLKEHDKLVTGIDWSAQTNRIVTCSQDRNAYVWTWDDKTKSWKPALVLLRINRAATQVKWSPNGEKFAVASGARCISVCYFEKDNDWWVSKHIKKPIRSTVLSIDWHPNNALIAAGSADFKARIFAAGVKGVDSKPEPTVWGNKLNFGDVLAEFTVGSVGGWIHDVAFSPDGESLAFVGHGSTLSVVSGKENLKVTTLYNSSLPYRCLLWLTAKSLVAAGHDNNPTLFSQDGGNWKLVRELDAGKQEEAKAGTAFDKFRQMDSRGQESDTDTKLKTLHQNAISGITVHTGNRGAVQSFSTIGVDGQLITWEVKALEAALSGLKIA